MFDTTDLEPWRGRSVVRDETLDRGRVAAFSATLDRDDPEPKSGDPLPPGAHWLYFWERTQTEALGPDGHAPRGSFIPPVALPHRMWAAGALTFENPLRLGRTVVRRSTIADIRAREGRSGPLVFVEVRHEIFQDGLLGVREQQTIVYRGDARPSGARGGEEGEPARERAPWERVVHPGPVLLFRYSALTFNAHRIHFDHPWCVEHEGYPGVVVHGPLLATWLLDLVRRHVPDAQERLRSFSFRALRPLFAGSPIALRGWPHAEGARLEAAGPEGPPAMQAEARIDPR